MVCDIMRLRTYSTFIVITIMLIVLGCEDSSELSIRNENVKLSEKIEQLEDSLVAKENQMRDLKQERNELYDELIYIKNNMEEQIQQIEDENIGLIKELRREVKLLESELININVFEENLFIASGVLAPDRVSIKKIKELLGEPKEINESVNVAHSGLKVISLIYENAIFTFEILEEKDLIKWITLKDSLFTTQRGISVGSTQEMVIKEYGNESYNFYQDNNIISYGEKTGITFDINNGIVNEIHIWFMYE